MTVTDQSPRHEQGGARVERLVASMTLEEKLGQLHMPFLGPATKPAGRHPFVTGELLDFLGPGGGFFGVVSAAGTTPREQAEWCNEMQRAALDTRLGIPLLQIVEGTHGSTAPGATVFPEGAGIGSTWNTRLVQRVFRAAAAEARAVGVHALSSLLAEVNRDPRLGRNCEAYSEDPYLTAEIVRAVVRGVQGEDVASDEHAAAMLTVFPTQNPTEGGLERGEVQLSERELRSVALPPWVAGVSEEGALMVMASYAVVLGEATHMSRRLLTGWLRDELGFDGVVVEEGGGLSSLLPDGDTSTQNFTDSWEDAAAAAIRAGLDVSISFMPGYLDALVTTVRDGKVPVRLVDLAVRRVLSVKEKLGLFDRPFVDPRRAEEVVHSSEHRALAREAATESIVLLKNEGALLPLVRELSSVAVIGPAAADAANQLGDYAAPPSEDIVTVLDGLRRKLPHAEVSYSQGCQFRGDDRRGVAPAVEAARAADVAVVVVGERAGFWAFENQDPVTGPTVGETSDVAALDLSGIQEELVRAVHATGTPTIVVLVNGRTLSIPWIAEHVPAIVEAWFPGEAGGDAVADILFGDVDPSGRLPLTIPRHVGQLPVYYNSKHAFARALDAGKPLMFPVSYADIGHHPLFEFGFGLSYTTFRWQKLRVSPGPLRVGEGLDIAVDVTNTGAREGFEVVQLYLKDLLASASVPVKELRGFHKVRLAPGETTTVRFELPPEAFSLVDAACRRVVEPGDFEIQLGTSAERIVLRETVTIAG